MIERTNAFKVGDRSFLTLVDAQKCELKTLLLETKFTFPITGPEEIVDWLLDNKVKVLDILTTTNSSKPRARKINGGTKVRRQNPPTTSTSTTAP